MILKKKRIGIFGGTFNPIHYGHLIIAENACEQHELEQVVFMPTGHTPHKPYMGEEMTKHRCRMTELAIADNPKFSLSYREIESPSVKYTDQTLEQIKSEQPETELYFILGADSLFDFDKWRCPERICACATILAAVRDLMTAEKVDEQIRYLREKFNGNFYRLESPNVHVSSNELRERIKTGQSIRYLVPTEVEAYIKKHKLYWDETGSVHEI